MVVGWMDKLTYIAQLRALATNAFSPNYPVNANYCWYIQIFSYLPCITSQEITRESHQHPRFFTGKEMLIKCQFLPSQSWSCLMLFLYVSKRVCCDTCFLIDPQVCFHNDPFILLGLYHILYDFFRIIPQNYVSLGRSWKPNQATVGTSSYVLLQLK